MRAKEADEQAVVNVSTGYYVKLLEGRAKDWTMTESWTRY